jgi:Flp pilus assembly protein TadG
MMNDRKFLVLGQAIVEFALALPLVLLLILGALEFGRAFQTKIVLENAAREGVHYFIYDKEDVSNTPAFANTEAAVIAEAANSGVTITTDDIVVQCFVDANSNGEIDAGEEDATCASGSTVDAMVTVDFDVAVIGTFTDPLPVSSNARMLVP